MKPFFLFFALFLIAPQIFSQAVIYKRNGEVISVYNLVVAGKTRTYQLPGDAEGIKRHISITAIDSIKYEDGSKDVFPSYGLKEKVQEGEIESFNRLLLGIDVAALLFYENLKISFEYLPGNGFIGLYAAYSLNTNPHNFVYYNDAYTYYIYSIIMKTLHWNGRVGVNAYIFPPGSFRLSSGLHYITGKYKEEMISFPDEEPWTSTHSVTDKSLNGLMFSPGLHWQPKDYLRITLAVDIGIYMKPKLNNNSILRTEISFNF